MAEMLEFELVSPRKLVFSEPVEMVVVPGIEGCFGALPRHAPMVSALRPGVVEIRKGGKIAKRIFVSGGFAEVVESRCTVLAQEAIPLESVTVEQAQERAAAAEEAVRQAAESDAGVEAEEALAVARALLDAVKV